MQCLRLLPPGTSRERGSSAPLQRDLDESCAEKKIGISSIKEYLSPGGLHNFSRATLTGRTVGWSLLSLLSHSVVRPLRQRVHGTPYLSLILPYPVPCSNPKSIFFHFLFFFLLGFYCFLFFPPIDDLYFLFLFSSSAILGSAVEIWTKIVRPNDRPP